MLPFGQTAPPLDRFTFAEQNCCFRVFEKKTMDIDMPSKNERVELEMKIMRYRQWMRRMTDDEFLKRLREQVTELERKLREIDE
jgi:hypothetical protein